MAGTPLYALEAFQPPVLLGFIRNLLAAPAYRSTEFAPDHTIDDISFEYLKGVDERPVMASVLSWDAEAPIGGRPGIGQRLTGELPPIKRKSRISEKEIIRRYYQPRAGTTDQQSAITAVYADLARHVASIQATAEWLTMQALTEPKVVYDEGGIKIQFDYGHPAAQRLNLQTHQDGNGATISSGFAGGLWTDKVNSTPLTDLMHIADWMEAKTGERPVKFLCDQATIVDLCGNAQIKGWTYAQNAPDRPMAPEEVNQTFQRYNLPTPDVYRVSVQKEAADGSLSTVYCTKPEKITLLPAQTVGERLWGPTAESRVLQGTVYSQQAPGIMGGTYYKDEPPSEWTKAAAVMFPTMPNIDKVVQVTVRDPAAATALTPTG